MAVGIMTTVVLMEFMNIVIQKVLIFVNVNLYHPY